MGFMAIWKYGHFMADSCKLLGGQYEMTNRRHKETQQLAPC